MTAARRFRIEIGGQVLVGLAFTSEVELEAFLGARGGPVVIDPPPRPAAVLEQIRAPGRPSFAAIIAAALKTLGKKTRKMSLKARARAVQKKIAETQETAAIPALRTIEHHLANRPACQNSRQKSRRNSAAGKIDLVRRSHAQQDAPKDERPKRRSGGAQRHA